MKRARPLPLTLLAAVAAASALLASPCAVPGVAAWGHEGHLYACAVADALLTPAASARVKALLPDWAKGYLPSVCSWPDVVGHTAPWRWSLPLHYVDTPDNVCGYDFKRDCHYGATPGWCCVSGILNYTAQLAKSSVSAAASASAATAGASFELPLATGGGSSDAVELSSALSGMLLRRAARALSARRLLEHASSSNGRSDDLSGADAAAKEPAAAAAAAPVEHVYAKAAVLQYWLREFDTAAAAIDSSIAATVEVFSTSADATAAADGVLDDGYVSRMEVAEGREGGPVAAEAVAAAEAAAESVLLSMKQRASEGSGSSVETLGGGEGVGESEDEEEVRGGGGKEDPSVFSPTVALMFVSHFLGDIHQPLHVGFTSDYGGNRIKVHWFSKKTNLHEVWDTEIVHRTVALSFHNNGVEFVADLVKRVSEGGEWADVARTWAECAAGPVCPNQFARESIQNACKWAYKDVATGDTLGDAYYESRSPVVQEALAKAGVRLAALLNRLFTN